MPSDPHTLPPIPCMGQYSVPEGWCSSVCSRCASVFGCGNSEACWCMDLPRRALGEPAGEGCLCPNCLRAALDK